MVSKEDAYTERGWLYGIKDGQYGLFPAQYVEKMSPRSIRKEIKVTEKNSNSINSVLNFNFIFLFVCVKRVLILIGISYFPL